VCGGGGGGRSRSLHPRRAPTHPRHHAPANVSDAPSSPPGPGPRVPSPINPPPPPPPPPPLIQPITAGRRGSCMARGCARWGGGIRGATCAMWCAAAACASTCPAATPAAVRLPSRICIRPPPPPTAPTSPHCHPHRTCRPGHLRGRPVPVQRGLQRQLLLPVAGLPGPGAAGQCAVRQQLGVHSHDRFCDPHAPPQRHGGQRHAPVRRVHLHERLHAGGQRHGVPPQPRIHRHTRGPNDQR
jgi:hypothetical protein